MLVVKCELLSYLLQLKHHLFTFNFKVENIKIIPGSYEVVISSKLLSRFRNTGFDVTYYIALEPDSTFG